MNRHDLECLLQRLDGTLSDVERRELDERLDSSPALRVASDRLRATRSLLRASAPRAAAAPEQVADRVLRRLDARSRKASPKVSPEEELFRGLWRLFRPVALAGLLLVAGLATYNAVLAEAFAAETGPAETVLALPPESLQTAYVADVGY